MMSLAQKIFLIIYFGLVLRISDCSKNDAVSQSHVTTTDTSAKNQPAVKGRLVYHSYSCYECNDSRIYMYDFSTNELNCISSKWNIGNPMNAHFSPDGKKLVFMGISPDNTGWDIYLWAIGTNDPPTNLTAAYGNVRDEDPKFSADGTKIIFKQNGRICTMGTDGKVYAMYTIAQKVGSMPYYIAKDSVILYSGSEVSGSTSDIYALYIQSGKIIPLSAIKGVEEYYPIACDDTSFFYTSWAYPGSRFDQVYLGFMNGNKSVRLPFNESDADFSDAFPAGEKLAIISSTKKGGKGAYDLYITDIHSGKIWSLDLYNNAINSAKNELGACYSPY